MQLVIVESPAKAKTINKYLGNDYKVIASYGHIRDLPSKDGSVRPQEDFAMTYEVNSKSAKHVKAMIDALKQSDAIILATDPDREGEAISWHIVEALREKKALKKNIEIKRVVFNEITRKAVTTAMTKPRAIDMNLVNAQQARRALDYLVGFTLSPVLWRKLPGSRSAGRVQSVALRLICEREAEIETFISREYWDIRGRFTLENNPDIAFEANLTHVKGQKLEKFTITNEQQAKEIQALIESETYKVESVEKKQLNRHPYAPFTTSSLQQEASRKLGFSTSYTMQLAQKLYEGAEVDGETVGLITYMRTDGVQVSEEAVAMTRQQIESQFGKNYVPEKAREYKTKAKNAQEAHEAIRPTDMKRTPERLKKELDKDMWRLYELIWKRMMASQMASMILDQLIVVMANNDKQVLWKAVGSVIKFPGFAALYLEDKDDHEEEENAQLPPLQEKQSLNLVHSLPKQHFTEPPPRYGEASLVKKMEELGIGRPSTYATIISVLQDRGYVRLEKKRFHPEERGRLVTAFLTGFFKRYVEYDFTAELEDQLDHISAGDSEWKEILRQFWETFHHTAEEVKKREIVEILEVLNELLKDHIFPQDAEGNRHYDCPECKEGRLSLKLGKFGAFIACSNYPECRYTKPIETAANEEGEASSQENEIGDRLIGKHPFSQNEIWLKKGPYGWYVQEGEVVKGSKTKPKRVAIAKHLNPHDITLDQATELLSLPRTIGIHPETGKEVTAGIGRFGPFVHHEKVFASIPADEHVLSIGMNRAMALLAEKEANSKASGGAARLLGNHPETGAELALYKGKFGPYLKYDSQNFKLPKGASIEQFTLEEALSLVSVTKDKAPATKKKRNNSQ